MVSLIKIFFMLKASCCIYMYHSALRKVHVHVISDWTQNIHKYTIFADPLHIEHLVQVLCVPKYVCMTLFYFTTLLFNLNARTALIVHSRYDVSCLYYI